MQRVRRFAQPNVSHTGLFIFLGIFVLILLIGVPILLAFLGVIPNCILDDKLNKECKNDKDCCEDETKCKSGKCLRVGTKECSKSDECYSKSCIDKKCVASTNPTTKSGGTTSGGITPGGTTPGGTMPGGTTSLGTTCNGGCLSATGKYVEPVPESLGGKPLPAQSPNECKTQCENNSTYCKGFEYDDHRKMCFQKSQECATPNPVGQDDYLINSNTNCPPPAPIKYQTPWSCGTCPWATGHCPYGCDIIKTTKCPKEFENGWTATGSKYMCKCPDNITTGSCI